MEQVARAAMLLVVVSNALAVDLHRFLWIKNPVSKVPEEAQVVEIVRWRQPICLMPAQGVSPCFNSSRKLQDDYERVSGKGMESVKEEDLWEVPNLRSSIQPENEDITRLISPEIVSSIPLSAIQPSEPSSGNLNESPTEKTMEFQLKTPELTTNNEQNLRGSRYLPGKDATSKPQQIYVTKVLNSPVTATLVAYNCLPDVGLPLCQDHQAHIEPSKSVLDSRPSLSISIESDRPVIEHGSQGSVWKDPADSFVLGNPQHSFGSIAGANHKLPQSSKPEIIISKPSFGHSVTSFPFGGSGSTQTGGLLHIVTAGGSHTVTNLDHRPIVTSPPKFNFHERPSEELTPGQSINTELSIEFAKDTANEETDGSIAESSITSEGNKHHIFQVIHNIVNKTEKSSIVQGIQKILQKSSEGVQQGVQATSSVGGAIWGTIFKSAGLFQSMKTMSTTTKPEGLENGGVDEGESITQPSLGMEETSTLVEILRKPENDVSNIPGLLDVFGQLQDNVNPASLAKPTEKPGIFGDLFANPVRPILESRN